MPTTEKTKLLLQTVLETPPDRRASFLESACAGNEILRNELLELLEASELAADFLEQPLLESADDEPQPTNEPDIFCGSEIGGYRLLERIGEGAMGQVYSAIRINPCRHFPSPEVKQTEVKQTEVKQTDGGGRQDSPDKLTGERLAFKLLKQGICYREYVARFEVEQHALSLMQHDNIAKVVDAGETSSGRPYLVMELIEGPTITEYCDNLKMPVRERVRLFIKVCEAIRHAHQKGIIHRDLKPSNVLVEPDLDDPTPKVIDFGVAKTLGGDSHQQLTSIGRIIGTPHYMSPEQAQFDCVDVDVRSDIYSLGVMLFELVTGETPRQRDTSRRSMSNEPRELPRPSDTAVDERRPCDEVEGMAKRRSSTPSELAAALRGDLDAIIGTALRFDREQRYQSAQDLTRDLQRYLHGAPIAARPPMSLAKMRQFAGDNLALVTLSGAAMLLLITTVLGVSVSLVRTQHLRRTAVFDANRAKLAEAKAQHQRLAASAARKQAQDNLGLAFSTIDAIIDQLCDESKFDDPKLQSLRAKMLKNVLEHAESFADEGNREELRLRVALAYHEVARATARIGPLEEALRLGQSATRILRSLRNENPNATNYAYHLSVCLSDESHWHRGVGAIATARSLQDETRRLSQWLIQQDSAKYAVNHAAILGAIGESEYAEGHFDAARNLFRRAIDVLTDLERNGPAAWADLRTQIERIGMLSNYATALNKLDKDVEALKVYLEAAEIAEEHLIAFPENTDLPAYAGVVWDFVAGIHQQRGDWDSAFEAAQKAESFHRQLMKANPRVRRYRSHLANARRRLGQIEAGRGSHRKAIVYFENACELHEQIIQKDAAMPHFHAALASLRNLIADCWEHLGEWNPALESRLAALAAWEKASSLKDDTRSLHRRAMTHRKLAQLFASRGKFADVARHLDRALQFQEHVVRRSNKVDRRRELTSLRILASMPWIQPLNWRHLPWQFDWRAFHWPTFRSPPDEQQATDSRVQLAITFGAAWPTRLDSLIRSFWRR